MTTLRIAICSVLIAACGPKAGITETRMIMAPAREASCALQLVEVDITRPDFNQTWDVLGYVNLLDHGTQDAAAEENRALVRPRACAMGGTSIAVAMNSATTTAAGQGSGLVYMVLRPKTAGAAPSTF